MSLSADQKRTLAAVLDTLVPPSADGRMPGAGELDLAGAVEAGLAEQPALLAGLQDGLAKLDEVARADASRAFAELEPAERRRVLEQQPELAGTLIPPTFSAYYQHPRVLEALGLEARPPYPRGYDVPPTDFAALEPVRRKAPLYRLP